MQRISGAPVLGQPDGYPEPVTVLFQLLGGNPRLLIWAIIALGKSSLLVEQDLPAGAMFNPAISAAGGVLLYFFACAGSKCLAPHTMCRSSQGQNWLGAGKKDQQWSCSLTVHHGTVVATHAPFGFNLWCSHAWSHC